MTSVAAAEAVYSTSVQRQKGLTGYCFKYIDKTFLPPN